MDSESESSVLMVLEVPIVLEAKDPTPLPTPHKKPEEYYYKGEMPSVLPARMPAPRRICIIPESQSDHAMVGSITAGSVAALPVHSISLPIDS